MAERLPEGLRGFLPEKGPSKSQVLTVVAVFPIGGLLLVLSGVTLTASVVGLAITTPLFLLFSPVLVPAAIAIGLAVIGFLASGAFGLTGLSSLSCFMEEARRLVSKAPNQLEQVRQRTAEAVGHVGQRTKEATQGMQGRT
ncbi:oleosin 18 kDa-like [Phoenix dactylifera]|uniref:Oleosin 18 kDa-like n=1 Tax=Phoenix dactylifera TaxID=42345 RepID=A0A8B7CM45_PHODC|nr:oleosin 18 kDa-like [Phoenix dactylifera]